MREGGVRRTPGALCVPSSRLWMWRPRTNLQHFLVMTPRYAVAGFLEIEMENGLVRWQSAVVGLFDLVTLVFFPTTDCLNNGLMVSD